MGISTNNELKSHNINLKGELKMFSFFVFKSIRFDYENSKIFTTRNKPPNRQMLPFSMGKNRLCMESNINGSNNRQVSIKD